MSKRTEEIGEFNAVDAKGNTWIIHVYQEFIGYRHLSGAGEVKGLKFLKAHTGENVNYNSDTSFTVVQSNVQLTTDDPRAQVLLAP